MPNKDFWGRPHRMLREEAQHACGYAGKAAANAMTLGVIAYRSVANPRPSDEALQELLRAAQSRNKAEGLTGVLVYDRGEFFQWLEGPSEALGRVWDSILHDPRHAQITVLRHEPIADRVFDGWDLRIAVGGEASVDAAVAAMQSPCAQLRRAVQNAKAIIAVSLEDLFATIVIPRLRAVHGGDVPGNPRRRSTDTIWHAELGSGAKFARILMAPKFEESSRYVDSLLEQGAHLDALFQEVFEPAQLHLGHMWDEDRCNDFNLTIGLARMQAELMRVIDAVPAEHSFRPGMSVLLSSQPEEPHRTGLLMSSEVFSRGGWEVRCQSPRDDQTLRDLVHAQWFDVLKLSQSSSLRRDNRLAALRHTIDSARAASLNRALIILVDGRTFMERPQLYRAVHANAVSTAVLQAVPLAQRLLATSRNSASVSQVTPA